MDVLGAIGDVYTDLGDLEKAGQVRRVAHPPGRAWSTTVLCNKVLLLRQTPRVPPRLPVRALGILRCSPCKQTSGIACRSQAVDTGWGDAAFTVLCGCAVLRSMHPGHPGRS